MGCCEARDKRTPLKDYKDELTNNSAFNAQELQDLKLPEIESYALYLSETTTYWTVDLHDAIFTIKHLSVTHIQSSQYCSTVRCSYYYIDFKRKIDHQLLIDVMEKESIRKQWDSKVREIRIARCEDGCRLLTSRFSKLMFNRTLIEKRVTRVHQNEHRVAYYSPGVVDIEDTGKAFTFFGLHRYITTAQGTTMMLFSQTDFRMPELVQKAISQIKGESEKWLKACYAQVLEIL